MAIGQAINNVERKEIEKAYLSLLDKVTPVLTEEDKVHIKKAYEMGLEGHKYQRRKSGEPYFLHPIEVARICFEEIGLGPTAVICAILHDVVEDTPVTLEEVQEAFGEKISKIVDGLTKLDGLYNMENPQAENFKKVLSTLIYDVRVVLIKMADRLHNLRTIGSMPKEKQLKIAAETSYIYAPLAHRLGQYKIKTEFQDICMKISNPEVYLDIQTKLKSSEEARSKYINSFIRPIEEKLDELDLEYRILTRSKAISSIYNKIKTKSIPFEEIYDLFAIRIILDVPIDKEKGYSWQVYSIITDVYKPIPERLKDWITTPKGNGYESLHTTVIGPEGKFVEVQIRSERMDEIAERGFAAHWKYKGVKSNENVFDTWLDNIRDIMDTQHTDAIEFVNDFKSNLFSEEVYVFTPNGEMRILPKGATALDFAFDIHSDIGYHATAIKVNNKLVPMGYKLKNGDQLHVTTQKNQKPKEDWLKMVVTGKAKSKIRSSMKEERRKKGELGMEAIQRKLKHMKADFEENIDMLAKHFGYKSRPDLYYAVATDEIKVSALKDFHTEGNKLVLTKKEEDIVKEEPKTEAPKKEKTGIPGKSNILVNGEPADQYEFTLAACCNPVQGDDIFGYLTATNGLKIHRTVCPNATNILANYGYRMLKAEWSDITSTDFVVDLLIIGVDFGPGVIQMITNEISNNLGINIRSFSIAGDEGYFEGKVSLVVMNKNQLNVALNSIKKLKGVSSVTRIEKKSGKKNKLLSPGKL